MRLDKRLGVIAGALGALLAGGVVAYALFSATGTGSGRASATTAVSITITPQTCASADLYPGGPAGALCFTLTNSNPYNVTFTSVSYGTAITSSDQTNCPASNVSVATNAPTAVAFSVAHGATSGTLSIAGVVSMASTAGDGCQGKSFTVPVTLTGTQQ
jgi:hypothetical protein